MRSIHARGLLALLCSLAIAAPTTSFAAGEERVLVAEDATGDAALDPTTAPLGTDLAAVYMHRPDFEVAEIQIVFKVTELSVPPPHEVIRYTWTFTINGQEFMVQAKTSDVVSAANADAPDQTASYVAGSFRLRGNCETVGARLCHHLRWLNGEFDVEADEVRVRVPLGDPVSPLIAPGALINSGVAEAGFQAAFSLKDTTTDSAEQLEEYQIP